MNTIKNLSNIRNESDVHENPTPEQLNLMNKIRFWKNDYDKWNEGTGPKPGPHPDPTNIWNTSPESFDYDFDTPK